MYSHSTLTGCVLVATPPEQVSTDGDEVSTIEACGRRSRTESSTTIMRDRAWPCGAPYLCVAFDNIPIHRR